MKNLEKNKTDKISVIVPVYKVEQYLDRCINSIVNQTYKNLEIILVDDGSPDESPAICDMWAKKDKRIKVIHKENGGVSSARNIALKNATGKHIAFVDSDDTIEKEMYEKMVALIDENNDTVFCKIKNILLNGTTINNNEINLNQLEKNKDDISSFYYRKSSPENQNTMGSCCRILFNADIIKNNNLTFNTKIKYQEDKEFLLRYLLLCKGINLLDEYLYNYYQTPNSAVTNKTAYKNFLENCKVLFDHEFETINKNPYLTKKQIKKLRSRASLDYCTVTIYRHVFGNAKKEDFEALYKNKDFKYLLKQAHFVFDKKLVSFKRRIIFILIQLKCLPLVKYLIKKKFKIDG